MDTKTVAAALHSDDCVFKRNRWNVDVWFMIGDPIKQGWSPKQQMNHPLPPMPPNYFIKLDELKDSVRILKKHFCPGVTTRAASSVSSNSGPNNDSDGSNLCEEATGSSAAPPPQAPSPLGTGFVVQDIDLDHDWNNTVLAHGRICAGAHLVPVNNNKKGCEVITHYKCTFCNKTLTKRRSQNDQTSMHRGVKGSAVNVNLANAIFASGIGVQKALELFGQAGIVCPSASVLQEQVDKVKDAILDMSEETQRDNRKEHVAECRRKTNYAGDIVFTDENGKEHHVARGAVAADGGGETRAYNHHITGSQHCLIVFSLVTNKPIFVKNHQISCKRCSLAFTKSVEKAMAEGKPYHDPTTFSTKHDGKCYKNTNLGPAVAEEYACEEAAEYLLCGPTGEGILPDDEAIFVDEFISDGDTRGAKKFIAKQVEIIGDKANGIAQYFPDFGHFIKCISNALFSLRGKDSTYSGVDLLESSRIKALSADVSRHIRQLHEYLESDGLSKEEKEQAKKRCLDNLYAIVPHHCGNHEKCSPDHCLFKAIIRRFKARKAATGEDFTMTDVKAKYAEEGRFRGKNLSIGPRGQVKV